MPSQESEEEPKPSPEVRNLRRRINRILKSKGLHLRLVMLNIMNEGNLTSFEPMKEYIEEFDSASKIMNDEVLKFRASKKWIVAYYREVESKNRSYARECDRLTEALLKEVSELMLDAKACEEFRDGESLSVRISFYWDRPKPPKPPKIEAWQIMEVKPYQEIYPDSFDRDILTYRSD